MMKNLVVALIALIAIAGVAHAETYTGLVVDKSGTAVVADPAQPNLTFVNIAFSISADVLPYVGKIVEVTGTLNPERSFPTLQTIESIKEVQ